jgi:hypothetical protein
VKARYGLSFEALCDRFVEVGRCCLILDDIPAGTLVQSGQLSLSQDVEEIAAIALQYCSELLVILRSRSPPPDGTLPTIALKAFDEADLRSFVEASGQQYASLLSPASIQTLYRHTDGVPVRVEAALKDLEVVALSDLINSNADLIADPSLDTEQSPATPLVRTIATFQNSQESLYQRAFDLLKTLSIFPRGEQLNRIRRFRGAYGYYPPHASELKRFNLVDTLTTHHLSATNGDEPAKVLVVPRLVRERVRGMMSSEEFQRLNRRAAELYFGSGWESGSFRPSAAYRFDDPHCELSVISNANAIVLRLLADALNFGGEREVNGALGLASTYVSALFRGDHFGGALALLEDLCPQIPLEGYESKRTNLFALFARALRMKGEPRRAIELVMSLDLSHLPGAQKQQALLTLLLSYERTGNTDELAGIAAEIIKIDRLSAVAWQAKSVVLRQKPASPERAKQLKTLESYCRKNHANIVANEIALTRADEIGDDVEQLQTTLAPVLASTSNNKEFYVRLRATLKLLRVSSRDRGILTDNELITALKAYRYLLDEGLETLFDEYHQILWSHFERTEDALSLFLLFRRSSLYWRLRARRQTEQKFADRLRRYIVDKSLRLINRNPEYVYFEVRSRELSPSSPAISGGRRSLTS